MMRALLRPRLSRSVLAVASALAIGLSACSTGGDSIELTATFDDVGDLVERGSVRAGDIIIGTITNIELSEDNRARVTFTVGKDSGLPSQVEARIRRTSLLGERYIDLVPLNATGTLAAGDIQRTYVVNDLENLVGVSTELLQFTAADKLAAAVQLGADAFGNRGDQVGDLLDNLGGFIGELDADQDTILRLIDRLDAATARLAPNAERNAATLADLRRAVDALDDEDEVLLDALDAITRLSTIGTTIMREQADATDDNIRRLRVLVDQLTRVEGALQNFLVWLPRHNEQIPNGTIDKHTQVWLDFVVCGVNEPSNDPSASCEAPNPGESNDPPPGADDDPCNDELDTCDRRNEAIEEGN